MKPDNCFRIGTLWEDQQWATFLQKLAASRFVAGGRFPVYIEGKEDGARIIFDRTKDMGWCPPGSWEPTIMIPFHTEDLRSVLSAGGVGAPEKLWPQELRELLTLQQASPEHLLELLCTWKNGMFKRAQKAKFGEVSGGQAQSLPESAKPVEPVEPAEPAGVPEVKPEPLSTYGWTLNLSDTGEGQLTGHVTIFQPAPRGETSRQVGILTFHLNAQDKRFCQDLVRSITQETPPWVEGAFSQLLTLMCAAREK